MIMNGYEIDTININTWAQVEQYIDSESSFVSMPPSYFERAIYGGYPKDAFSKGQLASKSWLLEKLFEQTDQNNNHTVALLGCWVGSIVQPLISSINIERVYGIDVDPDAIELAERFNQRYVQDGWKFKGVVADAATLNTGNMFFETGGELIHTTPDLIINTSCEHMDTHWFNTAEDHQMIAMQTNDSEGYMGHINTCTNIEEMFAKYPMRKRLYAGIMKTPAYTRFMQIGYR
jgi:hypothetical protein